MVYMMLFTVVATLVLSTSFSFVLKDLNQEFRTNPGDFRAARHVMERPRDFSACVPGSKLTLEGKVLNKKNLALTTMDAVKLVPLLHHETLEDRMNLWCKLAALEVQAARGQGRKPPVEFAVEELDSFQGDMVLDKETADMLFGVSDEDPGDNGDKRGKARLKRAVSIYEQFYWEGEIRWQFSPTGHDSAMKDRIRKGFNFVQDNTCVKFREFPASPNLTGPHVRVINADRCWAVTGKRSNKGQGMSIAESCSDRGAILHEILHVLGLFHEHTRPDRDLYLNINTENVWDGQVYLNLVNGSGTFTYSKTMGIPFDPASIMHYSAYAFSKNSLPTITHKDPLMEQVLGQRETLSFFDMKFINTIYACAANCGVSSLEWNFCQNGGYRDPNNCNQCKCPDGFAPPSCSEISSGRNANCGQTELVASEVEKTLRSPGYPNGYPGSADCAWIIRAPPNQRLRLQFKGAFHVEDHPLTCRAYVEVRHKDATLVGPRFCRDNVPTDVIRSHGEEAMVLLHTKAANYTGFSISYKTERCGGCTVDAALTEPLCFKTEQYDCSVNVRGICENRYCTQRRKNTCIRESSYCCPGYEKSGQTCKRLEGLSFPVITQPTTTTTTTTQEPYLWSAWGTWSGCSATCGMGALAIRKRVCLKGNCEGPANQGIYCGPRDCPAG